MGRYSSRIAVAYSTFYILGLVMSMQVPFVGFQPIRTSEHMAAAGMREMVVGIRFLINIWSLEWFLRVVNTGKITFVRSKCLNDLSNNVCYVNHTTTQ